MSLFFSHARPHYSLFIKRKHSDRRFIITFRSGHARVLFMELFNNNNKKKKRIAPGFFLFNSIPLSSASVYYPTQQHTRGGRRRRHRRAIPRQLTSTPHGDRCINVIPARFLTTTPTLLASDLTFFLSLFASARPLCAP